ncbi:MAG: AbrB family transcriptional regulator [Cyanobacteria bacterium K_Offshore_surface_m2_239]|nr:AbrB family transcriptional regulator [Cyanobacteria bacterium K_Offshore_surface_m2_239]
MSEGDTLVARQEEGRLVLDKPEASKQRLRARFARVPAEQQLVGERLVERRQEALKEGA